MTIKKQIGIIGGREVSEGLLREAYEAGKAVGEWGGVLLCGGLGGVMEAACRGARETGAMTVGVLPGNRHSDANPYVDLALPTGLGVARNAVLVQSCHGIVAVGGRFGTLSEMAFALQLNIPLISVGSWNPDGKIKSVSHGREAVQWLFEKMGSDRAAGGGE